MNQAILLEWNEKTMGLGHPAATAWVWSIFIGHGKDATWAFDFIATVWNTSGGHF